MYWGVIRIAAFAAAVVGALSATRLQAQEAFVFGGAEAGTDDLSSYTVGVSVFAAHPGWAPAAGLMAYRVQYPLGTGTTSTLSAALPSVGLRYQGKAASAQLNLGYVLLSQTVNGVVVPAMGAKGGVTASLLTDYVPAPTRGAQGILSYNWADRYLWTRLRGSRSLSATGDPGIRLGAEMVIQGEVDPPAANEAYKALQVGPMIEVFPGTHIRATGVLGLKRSGGIENGAGQRWYGKMELVWIP